MAALAAAAEEAGEEGQEAEEEVTGTNFGMSIMLLGCIGFGMSLFYLVKQEDPDMVKYSWQVISSTISIFVAVLVFQALNGFLEQFCEESSFLVEFSLAVAQFLMWFALLQLTLLGISHLSLDEDEDGGVDLEMLELNLKCWATLMGHITGFAAINAFVTLQEELAEMQPEGWRKCCAAFLIPLLAWMVLLMLGKLAGLFRKAVQSEDAKSNEKADEIWEDMAEETEDDVIGLAVSFLFVQAMRLAITGRLPNKEGEEPEEVLNHHTSTHALLLFGIGMLFALFVLVRRSVGCTRYKKGTKEVKCGRLAPQLGNVTAMCFAWSVFFTDVWVVSGLFSEYLPPGMEKQTVIALLVTFIALTLIFILDKIADMDATGQDIDNAIVAEVRALAILIGFSWEKAFDVAVVSIGKKIEYVPEPVTKVILALILAAVVIPAWRMHILPTILELEHAEEEEKEEAERQALMDVPEAKALLE